MKAIASILFVLFGLTSNTEAAIINVNVVGWPWVGPSYDTTIVAAPGDSLIVFNATTGFMGFLKEVNNVRVDTLPGVFQGDTADVHVLNWNHNTVGYYIETQVWNEYGLRCTINFLNTGMNASVRGADLFKIDKGVLCTADLPGEISVYTLSGSVVLREQLLPGSNCFVLNCRSQILIAEMRLSDGTCSRRKLVYAE